jgi:hypothetical protein
VHNSNQSTLLVKIIAFIAVLFLMPWISRADIGGTVSVLDGTANPAFTDKVEAGLDLTAVPEPSSLAVLAGVFAAGLIMTVRRNRKPRLTCRPSGSAALDQPRGRASRDFEGTGSMSRGCYQQTSIG